MSREGRRSPSWEGRGAVVALLLAVQALASLHAVIVPHRRCAEHGELVEGAAHAAEGLAQPAATSSHASAPSGDSTGTHDDHDRHCLLCSLQAPNAAGGEVRAASLPAAGPSRAPAGTELPKRSIPIVAIAPKSSPPVGAPKV